MLITHFFAVMFVAATAGCEHMAPSTGLPNATVASSHPHDDKSPVTAEQWLGYFEKHLAKVKTIHAEIVYVEIDGVGILDDKETRHGELIFQAAAPEDPHLPETRNRRAKFAIHFVKRTIEKRPEAMDMWYIFDGKWLVRRNNAEKILNKDQIVPPDAPPDQVDPLSAGDGPFFFPVTAKKQQVLKRFDAKLMPGQKNDPPETVHLRLTPKPGRRMEITQLDIWYSRKNGVPLRVETLDDAPNQKIVSIEQMELDQPVKKNTFDVSVPKDRGWQTEVRPYKNAVH